MEPRQSLPWGTKATHSGQSLPLAKPELRTLVNYHHIPLLSLKKKKSLKKNLRVRMMKMMMPQTVVPKMKGWKIENKKKVKR